MPVPVFYTGFRHLLHATNILQPEFVNKKDVLEKKK